MADKGGGRWDVGREWIDPTEVPAVPRGPDRTADRPAFPGGSDAPQAAWPSAPADPRPDATRQPGLPVASGFAYPPRTGYPLRNAPHGADMRSVGAQRAPAPYQQDAWPPEVDVADDPAPRAGLIRPSRILLLLALVVSTAVLAYGLFVDKSPYQVAIAIVGLAMLGVSLLFTAAASLRGGVGSAREGSLVRSSAIAIFGGLCMLGAAGSIAAGVILALLYRP